MSVLTQHAPQKARETGGFAGGIAAIIEGKLYALQNPFALDGRVSSYPASARGYSVANSYLITQSDAAMLIDTGFGKDEPAIRAQVESLIAPGLPLSLFPLRLNEFMSINNVEAFAGHFNVETCYTSNVDAALWFDFGAKANGRSILESMKVTAVTRADTIRLGQRDRAIDVMQAPIRLIATRWLYDRATRTLFSSDMFTHVWRARENGPWIVTDADDRTSARELRSLLLNTRYWWLEGAPTGSFARGIAPLRYLFVTHQETPHCGGLGRILARFPQTILCGDVSDYHLAFPQYEHRMQSMDEGDAIDLGGRSLMAVEPVIRDLRTTWWGFETRERVLFPGDGFAYSHYHLDGHCGLLAEEAVSLDLPDVSAVFADLALFWTKFANMDAYCDRLDQLIERLGVKTIAPTHGLPITDVSLTVPKVKEGLKYGAQIPESGTNEKVVLAGVEPDSPALS